MMKSMNTIIGFCLLFAAIFNGCSNSPKIQKNNGSNEIIGEWIVDDMKFIGTMEDVLRSDEPNFLMFFGPEIWENAKGKRFTFTEEGLMTTDLIPQVESQEVRFTYKFDEKLMIKAEILSNNTTFEFATMVNRIDAETFVWKLSEYFFVRVKRVND